VRPKIYSDSYSEYCVTVMRSNPGDKVVLYVVIKITLRLEQFDGRWKKTHKAVIKCIIGAAVQQIKISVQVQKGQIRIATRDCDEIW